MKLILILTLISSCVGLGICIANFYKRRVRVFMDITYFCEAMKSNINFTHNPVGQIIDESTKNIDSDFKKILINYKLLTKNSISRDDFINTITQTLPYLNKRELEVLERFFDTLGAYDEFTENNNINNFKQLFLQFLNQAEGAKSKYSPMYLKLCVIFGLLLCILFI